MTESEYLSILMIICCVLIVMVILTIWGLKNIKFRYSHYTTWAIVYGIIISAIIHQSFKMYNPEVSISRNITVDDELSKDQVIKIISTSTGETYKYEKLKKASMESLLSFHSTIFFDILLPPIIFHAGYNLKKRHFTPLFVPILLFAFIGTVISAFIFSGIVYGLGFYVTKYRMDYQEALFFGSIIAATDPVTVLAIFADMKVESGLYALIFGESVLNDAVSIVLSRVVKEFGDSMEKKQTVSIAGQIFLSIGLFIGVFLGAIIVGVIFGLITSLITKLTKIRNYPEMEISIFLLLSLVSYMVSQALGMSGIVTILFCGITQAHYTLNNLSPEGRKLSKQFFSIINFIFENFIFLYIGLTAFTNMEWDLWLIFAAVIGIIVGRIFNIYPLSFLANLCHGHNRVPMNFQHFLYMAGLRGAIPFALALEYSEHRNSHILVSTTFAIVCITVVFCGITILPMIDLLSIKIGEDDVSPESQEVIKEVEEDVRFFIGFDSQIMSPMFTHKFPNPPRMYSRRAMPFIRFFLDREQIANQNKMFEKAFKGIEIKERGLPESVDFEENEEENLLEADQLINFES